MSIVAPGLRLPEWRADRRNARYVPALRLAEIVLANASAETGPSGLQMAAFVVDMARVYEDFVGTALTEALARYPGGTRLQYPSRLDLPEGDGRPRISMAVDVVHTVRGRPTLVFDAKYKAASPTGTYPNADHYQMLAYCTALKVPTAWLVYANGPQGRRRIVNSDVDGDGALAGPVHRTSRSAGAGGRARRNGLGRGNCAGSSRYPTTTGVRKHCLPEG